MDSNEVMSVTPKEYHRISRGGGQCDFQAQCPTAGDTWPLPESLILGDWELIPTSLASDPLPV